MPTLLTPPLAFVLYLVLGGLLLGLGRLLAGPAHPNAAKSSSYASGEAAPLSAAAPGYAAFYTIALFFAALHLGVLVLATSALAPVAGLFILGLGLALLVLLLG